MTNGINIALFCAMLLVNLLRTRFDRKNKVLALLIVIGFEIALASYLWEQSKPRPVLGFLAKAGNSYVVTWKSANEYDSKVHTNLRDAVRFLSEELRLTQAKNPLAEYELEHVWLQDRFGAFMLMWKTQQVAFLNQITFQSQEEAKFFETAFRAGSYTPSPIGHSVLFLPSKTQ